MTQPLLFQRIASEVAAWREDGYPCEEYPAVAEVLEWAVDQENSLPRFLRPPQLRALETYWYLRLVHDTPQVFDLYARLFPKHSELLEALGLTAEAFKTIVLDEGIDELWRLIREDDEFVRSHRLEALRETLTLTYSSYILALAMGAGKTILIGAIIATEFAMAFEYPEGPFVQNALVFAPGKTIIESLRELAAMPYEKILPPRLYKEFGASAKLTFTRDGEKTIPVIGGSAYNIVVTNTEKIRIQKETIRKKDLGGLFADQREDEAKAEVANLRLQAIASLPHLAVFSDEAHHTYGQNLDRELKRVRQTVDYLAGNTNVICVVNTTGTPYYKRQPLKDVVIWYGLSEGIRDGILKDLAGNIHAFDFDDQAEAYVSHVIEDFFDTYGDVHLPNGAAAKLAIYFPQNKDVRALKPVIDRTVAQIGQSAAGVLINTSDESLTSQADIDAFNRLNDPASPHRVILLVNKGTEGWNCPSLFACALARKLKASNNFVLQAATRCLRQIPGNNRPARVYLSKDNFSILDRQLQETYGETIQELNRTGQETRRARIVLRKLDIPPVVVSHIVRTVVRVEQKDRAPLSLTFPDDADITDFTKATYTVFEQQATMSVLRQVGETVTIDAPVRSVDVYAAAADLAAVYRADLWELLDALRGLYPAGEVPEEHLHELGAQIEAQFRNYQIQEESVDVALALVRPEGFRVERDNDGAEIYVAEIVYPRDREHLLLAWEAKVDQNEREIGFHYSPYNFDSNPELSFFEQLLAELNLDSNDIEDAFFTGAVTDPNKTDFYVEYRDVKGKWRRYTPDFLIRKKPEPGGKPGSGKMLIVEIKREHDRDHPVDGQNGRKAVAVRKLEENHPERFRYEMLFTSGDVVTSDQLNTVRDFGRGRSD